MKQSALRRLRTQARYPMSLTELAKATGISLSLLSRAECGLRGLSEPSIRAIAKALRLGPQTVTRRTSSASCWCGLRSSHTATLPSMTTGNQTTPRASATTCAPRSRRWARERGRSDPHRLACLRGQVPPAGASTGHANRVGSHQTVLATVGRESGRGRSIVPRADGVLLPARRHGCAQWRDHA